MSSISVPNWRLSTSGAKSSLAQQLRRNSQPLGFEAGAEAPLPAAVSRVSIAGFQRADETGKTIYLVKCTGVVGQQWLRSVRYSEFEALRVSLRGAPVAAPFPPKNSVRAKTVGLGDTFRETRRRALERWLSAVVDLLSGPAWAWARGPLHQVLLPPPESLEAAAKAEAAAVAAVGGGLEEEPRGGKGAVLAAPVGHEFALDPEPSGEVCWEFGSPEPAEEAPLSIQPPVSPCTNVAPEDFSGPKEPAPLEKKVEPSAVPVQVPASNSVGVTRESILARLATLKAKNPPEVATPPPGSDDPESLVHGCATETRTLEAQPRDLPRVPVAGKQAPIL